MAILDNREFFILVVVTLAVAAFVMVTLVILMRSLRDRSISQYNEQERRAELSVMRESFERRLEAITAQMMSTEHRWREVNHLLLAAQERQSSKKIVSNPRIRRTSQTPEFLREMGLSDAEMQVEKGLVFVLTPFDEEYRSDFFTIKTTCESVGLRCIRGDEEKASGDIFSHILRLIARADFVIANISSRNPNVYYELGIAQALGKQAILVSRDKEALSFDLQSQRIILYANIESLSDKLKDMLLRTVLQERSST
ncbi:hypothetical protein GIY62_22780 [Burkholderia plantarii]|uniref:hypothetical protein n=1 Tax=Burkholderia plantarii TaxID=41899 RepID=UPI00272B0881|nr:hypothetical protein [Burkholderia plantarii]WLE63159.1 hypothetical protein GIY62_22780 [Burkholderia plantarii]